MSNLIIPGSPDRLARVSSVDDPPPRHADDDVHSWDEYFGKEEGPDALPEPQAQPDVVSDIKVGDYVSGDFVITYAGADITQKIGAATLSAVDRSLGELAIASGRKWVDLAPNVTFDPSTRVRL